MRELSIFAAAEEAPTAPCLVDEGRTWSFSEMAARASSAIEILNARGVEAGQRVALTPRVHVDSVVWLYALFEAGSPALLVHPRLTPRERDVLLEGGRADYVIDEAAPHARAEPNPISKDVPAERTLAVVYTSGSRGTPRGAELSRRAFVESARAHAANLGWIPGDRWLLGMPPAHVGGLSILTRSLIARRTVVLAPGRFEPLLVAERMAREGVTLLSVVPTMLQRLLDLDPPWAPHPELRAVLVGGAPLSQTLRRRAVERGVPALATYGCTEACSQIATQNLTQVGESGCGAPLAGVDLRIERGEIQVRGDMLMRGYLGGDEASDTWTHDGWLRTGDCGEFLSGGQLQVLGRLDDVIVTGGENVSPQEVESWLETIPGVSSACVFGTPDAEWGELVAAAIVIDPSRYDRERLRTSMDEELAGHKRPRRIAVLDALPLNRSGKVDRALVVSDAEAHLEPI